jgi:hypothetical protein
LDLQSILQQALIFKPTGGFFLGRSIRLGGEIMIPPAGPGNYIGVFGSRDGSAAAGVRNDLKWFWAGSF